MGWLDAGVALVGHYPKPFSGAGDEPGSKLGAHDPNGRARFLNRKAARCHGLIRRQARGGRDHPDAIQRQSQFVRSDLGECRENALTDLDLARAHFDAAIARP